MMEDAPHHRMYTAGGYALEGATPHHPHTGGGVGPGQPCRGNLVAQKVPVLLWGLEHGVARVLGQ